MRPLLAAAASAALAAGVTTALLAPGAGAAGPDAAARTTLERSVLHDQQAAGELASPPFTVSRVRCAAARGFCNVTRTVETPNTYAEYLRRVRIVSAKDAVGWRYAELPPDQAARLAAAREGNLRRAISATWSGVR